jgi:protease IV
MTLETDLLIDRRRLKRRLFAWRIVAVVAVLAAILAGIGRTVAFSSGRHIARLTVSGLITENPSLLRQVDRLGTDKSVAAVILAVNSPGGSVAGGETLHDAIARLAERKPVVTVMGGLAASAAYMISVPTTRIFASPATLTGSIGVLLQTAEFSGLLDKVGVGAQTLVSGPLKDQPSLTAPLSPAGKQVLQDIVMNLYDQFVTMVADDRHLPRDRVRQLADGRAYTGQQALPLGLIDQLGGEGDARAWLAEQKKIPLSTPVRDVRTSSWEQRLTGTAGSLLGSAIFNLFEGAIQSTTTTPAVRLDGAWAVWQP